MSWFVLKRTEKEKWEENGSKNAHRKKWRKQNFCYRREFSGSFDSYTLHKEPLAIIHLVLIFSQGDFSCWQPIVPITSVEQN